MPRDQRRDRSAQPPPRRSDRRRRSAPSADRIPPARATGRPPFMGPQRHDLQQHVCSRDVQIAEPRLGTHALHGGIGPRHGDGGLMLGIAELITAAEEKDDIAFVLMNDRAHGVTKNIQDAQYDGRHRYSALRTPDSPMLCRSIGLGHRAVSKVQDFASALDEALSQAGPAMFAVEMT